MVHRPPFVSWSRNSKSESGPSVLWLVRASCFRCPGSSLRQVHCILVHFHGSPRTSTSFETFGDCEHLEERRLCVSVAAGYTSVNTDQSLAIFTNTEEEGEITQLQFEGLHLCYRKNVFGSGVSLNIGMVDWGRWWEPPPPLALGCQWISRI